MFVRPILIHDHIFRYRLVQEEDMDVIFLFLRPLLVITYVYILYFASCIIILYIVFNNCLATIVHTGDYN
jgi:hypothetical protein